MEVYVVLKNSDFTEGRGPMQLHKIFDSKVLAIRYVKDQPGIYGSPQDFAGETPDGIMRFNGYMIRPYHVISRGDAENIELLRQEKIRIEAVMNASKARLAEIDRII